MIVNLILETAFGKFIALLIKCALRLRIAKISNLEIGFDTDWTPDDKAPKEIQFHNKMMGLIKQYKSDGLSYEEIYNLFRKDLSKYNIAIPSLYYTIQEVYDRV